jgi:hypothetical protein
MLIFSSLGTNTVARAEPKLDSSYENGKFMFFYMQTAYLLLYESSKMNASRTPVVLILRKTQRNECYQVDKHVSLTLIAHY